MQLAVFHPTPSRAEREVRARRRASVIVPRCLADIAAAANLDVEQVRDPSAAPKRARKRARIARQLLTLWLRREHGILARHIEAELGLAPGVAYTLVRYAETSLGSLLWAVDFLARMKPPADEEAA